MSAFLAVLGTVLLFLGKLLLILVLLVLAVGVFLLLCPFCADVCWEGETLTVRAGAMGLTFPVFQYPKPEPAAPQTPPTGWRGKLKARFAAWRAKRKERAAKKTAPAKPKEPTPQKQKAKLTLQVVCTLARGCGRIMGAFYKDRCLSGRPRRGPRRGGPQLWPSECLALPGAGRAGPDLLPAI